MTITQSYQNQTLIIGALLSEFSIQRSSKINNYYDKIHSCFYTLKKSYPEYFSRLVFDENGLFPYSEDLDNIIQDLQGSGLINKLNPHFNTIIINKSALKKFIKENTQSFSSLPSHSSIKKIVSEANL